MKTCYSYRLPTFESSVHLHLEKKKSNVYHKKKGNNNFQWLKTMTTCTPPSPNKSVAITEILQVLKLHFTKSDWEKRSTKQEFAMVF